MIQKIAWRNVWRNKLRSFVVMTSIFLGVWSGIFVIGLSLGMNNQRTENYISTSIAHIQIHNPEFLKDNEINYQIDNKTLVNQWLQKNNILYTNRIKLLGMAASANGTSGVGIDGINPDLEKTVTIISNQLTDGNYFESDKKNQIVIGQKLAHKLKVKIGNKLVLTFQNTEGEIVSASFRVCGIFKTSTSKLDETQVFVHQTDLNRLLNTQNITHEIAINLVNNNMVDTLTESLKSQFPQLEIRNWKTIAPDLAYTDEIMQQFLYIIMIIILLALSFGIINTMMMAVLERKHELGMLMAVGMNKLKLFTMVVTETIYLSIISGPLGLMVGYFTIEYFSVNGLDFSVLGKGFESVGFSPIVYTAMADGFYLTTLLLVLITALVSSLFPAYRALKLKPVEAIKGL